MNGGCWRGSASRILRLDPPAAPPTGTRHEACCHDSANMHGLFMRISATGAQIESMNGQHVTLDPSTQLGQNRSRLRPVPSAEARPIGSPLVQLSDALGILATHLRAAVAERRVSQPAGERYRRADEQVAYLNELYLRLQRRMEIPAEIWLLEGGRGPTRGRRSPRRHPG